MISLVKIDGVSYDVLVTAIEEAAEIIEGDNSGTALYRNREIRDLQGVKYIHSITFDPDTDPDMFDSLFNYLFGTLRESVMLEVVHGQETISYEAAYNTGTRRVDYIDDTAGHVGWAELNVEFRSIETVVNGGA